MGCSTIKEAAAEGPTAEELAAMLNEPEGPTVRVVALLEQYGLVCKVPGYDTWAYVTSEHSASFFTDPESATGNQGDPHSATPGLALPVSHLGEKQLQCGHPSELGSSLGQCSGAIYSPHQWQLRPWS